jgi:ribosome-binding factor A
MARMAQNRFSPGAGPSQRQLRVGELIRRTLSEVLSRGEIHDPDLNRHSITVGEVRLSNDLRVATVHVMPLGGREVEAAIAALARNKGELRHRISKGMTLKYAPDLRFRPDETFDQLDETRRLFDDERVRRDVAARDSEDDAQDGGDA